MSEELKFKKLSEVELVEEASEDAHILIEENGQIKRAVGKVGDSGSSIPTFDLTPFVTLTYDHVEMIAEGILFVNPEFTTDEALQFVECAIANGVVRIQLDIAAALKNSEISVFDGSSFGVSQLFSVQHFSSPEYDGLPMQGVVLYTGLAELMYSMNNPEMLSLVALADGAVIAGFCFPIFLGAVLG